MTEHLRQSQQRFSEAFGDGKSRGPATASTAALRVRSPAATDTKRYSIIKTRRNVR